MIQLLFCVVFQKFVYFAFCFDILCAFCVVRGKKHISQLDICMQDKKLLYISNVDFSLVESLKSLYFIIQCNSIILPASPSSWLLLFCHYRWDIRWILISQQNYLNYILLSWMQYVLVCMPNSKKVQLFGPRFCGRWHHFAFENNLFCTKLCNKKPTSYNLVSSFKASRVVGSS